MPAVHVLQDTTFSRKCSFNEAAIMQSWNFYLRCSLSLASWVYRRDSKSLMEPIVKIQMHVIHIFYKNLLYSSETPLYVIAGVYNAILGYSRILNLCCNLQGGGGVIKNWIISQLRKKTKLYFSLEIRVPYWVQSPCPNISSRQKKQ